MASVFKYYFFLSIAYDVLYKIGGFTLSVKRNKKRKALFLTTISLSAFALIGCGAKEELIENELENDIIAEVESSNDKDSISKEVVHNSSDYIPATDISRIIYKGEGSEFASFERVIRDSGVDFAYYIDIMGTAESKLIKDTDDGLVFIGDGVEDYMGLNEYEIDDNLDILLPKEIQKDSTWKKGEFNLTVLSIDEVVSTDMGDITAIKVLSETNDSKGSETLYYAKGLGLIKREMKSEDGMVITSIISEVIKTNKDVYESTVEIFKLDSQAETIISESVVIPLRKGDSAKDALISRYSEIAPEIISSDVKIKSLNKEDDLLTIDFNSKFVSNMNAGANTEMLILNSVAKTFARAYNVDFVNITVEGEAYSSGHIALDSPLEIN